MLMLTLFVSTAMADFTISYKKQNGFWGSAVETYPEEINTVVSDNSLTIGSVYCVDRKVIVTEAGDITVTIAHVDGNHRQHILGVALKDAEGTIVYKDFHYGENPGDNNTYTLTGVAAGEYTACFYVCDMSGDQAAHYGGTITAVGNVTLNLVPVELENGIYIIREVGGDLVRYNGTDLARGALAANAGDRNHTFTITKGDNGFYAIQTNDGKYVTYSATTGNSITFSEAAEATDQNKWWAICEGNEANYRIIIPSTNYEKNAPGWNYAKSIGTEANAAVGLWDSSNANSQWYIVKAPYMTTGAVKLKIKDTYASSNGTNIVKANDENSIFTITEGENGCYTIQATDGKYLIYTSTSNHLLTVVDEASATDANKWWYVIYDMSNKDAVLDILPKQDNIGTQTPALNWSQDSNTKLGFWRADDGASYCSIEMAVVDGKFYTVKSAMYADNSMYVDNNVNPLFTNANLKDASNIFQFVNVDGISYMYNVSKGTYLSTSGYWGANNSFAATEILDAKAVTVESLTTADGQMRIAVKDGHPLHAQSDGKIVSWPGDANSASAWYINEVTEFAHTLTVGAAGYTTLVLGYNATVPAIEGEGNGVFTATVNGEWIDLTAVEAGSVLPANTAVIIKAAANTELSFAYSAETAAEVTTALSGTLYDKNVAPGEGNTAYVLSAPEGVVGFYKATLNKEENTAFKNNANKAYLVVEGAELAAYSFRFPGTTGIEEITDNREQSTVIYDLTGRRVEAITAPGIYIVNGVKRVVR